MTVKIPIKTRVKIALRKVEMKLGGLLIDIGKWVFRGCKPQPQQYKRSNGVIHALRCAGDFYMLEGSVNALASMGNPRSLVGTLRIVIDDAGILIDEVEAILQKVDTMPIIVSQYRDGVEHSKTEVAGMAEVGVFFQRQDEILNLVSPGQYQLSVMPDGQVVHYTLDQEPGMAALVQAVKEVQYDD